MGELTSADNRNAGFFTAKLPVLYYNVDLLTNVMEQAGFGNIWQFFKNMSIKTRIYLF